MKYEKMQDHRFNKTSENPSTSTGGGMKRQKQA
jgi:hypothetical protein